MDQHPTGNEIAIDGTKFDQLQQHHQNYQSLVAATAFDYFSMQVGNSHP